MGHLIVQELGATKDWARVCIADERFQWDSMDSPFTLAPSESIGVLLNDHFDGGTGPATMVVLSQSHYGSFRRALQALADGSLYRRMQAMEDGQDRFLQFLTEEAQRLEADGSLYRRMQAMEDGQDRFLQFLTEEAQRLDHPVARIGMQA
eukprot:CAMPEP_0174381886 /NCGR_PEP_ID=MMETSP0811_2-20130205/124291_1 /TAXON_ID=73025 ORGANISM="Eutreptiella gymnastica-like, Strain CCMP1594" /NCGR_SAMPLE_ID=MMETSP0811_2 /ASSEMBLY_ACC=CAM_ASM_000667 /LENGTH=149 /DNA_ID=CAMNT_0015535133 /DNA_START=261 /DNA_END=710 /DNA_ORIENTATION=+